MTDLSFIVPAYNEGLFIKKCLQTITELCQINHVDAEVIVIDNGSTDNTVALACQYTSKVYSIERNSVSAARNMGIQKAGSDLVAFIDADVVITQSWIDCFLNHIKEYLDDLNFITGYQYAVRENSSWIERHWFRFQKDSLLNGGNIITSKQLCERISGFDVKLKTGEDYDFCKRAIAAGVSYREEPGYVAIHEGFPRDLRSFYRRECWHGEGDFFSFSTFIHSPVALIAVVYLVFFIAGLMLLLSGNIGAAVILVLLLSALNLVITIKRFQRLPLPSIACNSVLNYVYFIARGMSLFRVLRNRGKSY